MCACARVPSLLFAVISSLFRECEVSMEFAIGYIWSIQKVGNRKLCGGSGGGVCSSAKQMLLIDFGSWDDR